MKILIIGLGSIAKKHINAIFQIEQDAEIYALRSSIKSCHYDNVHDLYSWNDIYAYKFDFAIISNPTSEHKNTIHRLINYKIPLFIEKPLSNDLKIYEEVQLAKISGIKTYVACNLRFLESICFVKKIISDKKYKINEVNIYCGSYLPNWRTGIDYKINYSSIPELGGGVHLDLIHELDYVMWIFGFPYNVKKTFKSRSSLDIKSYDYANYCLEYESFDVSIILNYYRMDSKRSFEILTDKNTIYVDLLENSVMINNELVFKSYNNIKNTYKKQIQYFIDNIKYDNNLFNDMEEAYEVLKICI